MTKLPNNPTSNKNIKFNDIAFFIPFGLVCGVLLEAFTYLPYWANRGQFDKLLNDHLPLSSIFTLIIAQIIIIALYHLLGNRFFAKILRSFAHHLSVRISGFCPPIYSILIGMSLSTLLFLWKNSEYIYLTGQAIFFAFVFFMIEILTSNTAKMTDVKHSTTSKEIGGIVVSSVVLSIIFFIFFNNRPIEVGVELSTGEYGIVKKAADKQRESINDFSRQAIVDKAIESNRD